MKKIISIIILLSVCCSCSSKKEPEGAELYAKRVQEHIQNGERVMAIDLLKEGIQLYDDETLKNLYFSLEGTAYSSEEATPAEQPEATASQTEQPAATDNNITEDLINDITLFMKYHYSATPEVYSTAENSKYYQVEVGAENYDGTWVFICDKKTKTIMKYIEGSDYDYFWSKDEYGIYTTCSEPDEFPTLEDFEDILNLITVQDFEYGKFFESNALYEFTNYDIINENGNMSEYVYNNFLLHPDGGIRVM